MHLFIATAILLGFVAAAQAQDRYLSALAQPAYALAPHHERLRTPGVASDFGNRQDGFSGSFNVRQTVRNLGY